VAIGAVTNYCTVLATVHAAGASADGAKMAATIDHVTGGRFAMNVVCGWFKNELTCSARTCARTIAGYAAEWLDLVRRAWTEEQEFD
jgi:alkanesulfonate monooxygenase SsuD/methylene tetrahydromethanopterin reductase-like flavin-dependent oxidoreductase (luciferase family)